MLDLTIDKKKVQFEPIEKRFQDSINDLNNKREISKIIQKNNISPNIIFLFLKKYFNEKKNFVHLKEALTSSQYKSLYKNKRSNPYETILLFFENIIKEKNNSSLIKDVDFIGYNIPFIYGIERVRMNYYLFLLKDKIIQVSKFFKNDLSCFQDYFNYLKTLNSEEQCDKDEINIIFYQFILEITEVIYQKSMINVTKIPNIYNKLNPNFIEYKAYKKNSFIVKANDSYLQKENNINYIISNGIETKNISEKNYNLELLSDELKIYTTYPLNLLLYRNESINYYYSQNKNFMEREGKSLFKQFKKYFFEFIKSKSFMEVLSKPEYKNVKEFILNKNIKHILLNQKYLKFIPFLSKLYGGFTNKDILLTVITAYPSLVELLPEGYNINKYEDIKNFCLLMSIAEKFILLLHEQIIPFIYGYLYQINHNKSMNISPKRLLKKGNKGKDDDEFLRVGGYYLEKQLFGGVINKLKITNVIVLFDGIAINKTNEQFKQKFNGEFNKKELRKMIKNCSGFLKYFLKEFPIDFEYILEILFAKNSKGIHLSTRGEKEPYIKVSSLPHYRSFSIPYINLSI